MNIMTRFPVSRRGGYRLLAMTLVAACLASSPAVAEFFFEGLEERGGSTSEKTSGNMRSHLEK